MDVSRDLDSRLGKAKRLEADMITGEQVRAARKLLGWSQVRLAGQSGVQSSAMSKFEMGVRQLVEPKVASIRQALEAAGVEFTNDGQPGVRMRGDAHIGRAMQQTESYRDFVYSWQEPPSDGRGYVMNIASEMPQLYILLESEDKVRHPFPRLEDAKEDARQIIDAAIARAGGR
jgi:transcriptional regulator with XRE-family HTH domain